MDNFVEKTGRTVQEAVESALEELNAEEDEVEIEVLDEGSKGILGLLGSKQARVRVTLKENRGDLAYTFLKNVFEKMNINADVIVQEESDILRINITGEDSGIIIGRRGETLDALQYLTSLVVNKESQVYKKVSLDIENYRQKREETLVNLANRLAKKVIKYKKSITLEPMNPYERKIIHSTLQEISNIETFSMGDEPNRKVTIRFRQ